MIDNELFFAKSTQAMRDFIDEKIASEGRKMIAFDQGICKNQATHNDHSMLFIITAPMFSSINDIYRFKCFAFDITLDKPTSFEFIFYSAFALDNLHYYISAEIFGKDLYIRLDEMNESDTVWHLIRKYDEIAKRK